MLWPGRTHREVATLLIAAGAGAVVVTMGGDGVSWYAEADEVTVPAPAVEVVDTIGAGDTVTAAVVHALWELDVVGPGAGERLRALAAAERTSVLALRGPGRGRDREPTGRRPAPAARARLTAVSRSGEPRPGRGR